MKKNRLFILIILICLIFVSSISCRRDDLSISQVLSQPYLKSDGSMGLSLYLKTSIKDVVKSSLRVTDPSGNLTWVSGLSEVEYNGTKYYGTSDICMPSGNLLPKGDWSFELLYKDGRTLSDTFVISYQNEDSVPENYPAISESVFDAASNLTLLP